MANEPLTVTPPDEAAFLLASMTVIAYVKEDGSQGYSIHTRGDVPFLTALGMSAALQAEIASYRNGGFGGDTIQ